ncbi:MAG: hypothetical protein RLZZ292_1497 [Bacteroidota bacterium]|jgi:hypothetical protein
MKKLSEIKHESTKKNEIVTKCETIKGGGCSCGDKRPGGNSFGSDKSEKNTTQSGNWFGNW